MKKLFLIIFILGSSIMSIAQEKYKMKGNEDYTEIDFLTSYYEQDGDNAAVTGGLGTEALTDFASLLIINIPLDTSKSLNVSLGADYYTSASTDNIDFNPSSASRRDIRAFGNVGFSKKNFKSSTTYGARLGFSTEYDYNSFSAGINFAKEFKNGNSELSFSAQAFIDQWKLYLPAELRGIATVPTTSRNSFNTQLTWSQVVNRRLQMAISGEAIYMTGLLSTPFHRVYFSDQTLPDLERLPASRLKIPLALRATWYPTEKLVVRSYYRFYTDDFGINAHTFSLDLPFKVSDYFSVSPFYRYHTQTASEHFAPHSLHDSGQEFYTSDYDLAALSSHKYGVALSYSPLYGISRGKLPFSKKLILFNSIDLRAARYTRDTGLSGYSIALGLNFRF